VYHFCPCGGKNDTQGDIGDFGVLLQAGLSPTKALVFNMLSASLAIVEALITLVASSV